MTPQHLAARSASLPCGPLLDRVKRTAMDEEETDNNIEPTSEELPAVPQTVGSFLMSIAFWSTLLVSAAMYAAVALSPKIADWVSVRQQHAGNSVRLQELEDEADYLERVAAALKKDPEFAKRLVQATQSGDSQKDFVPVSKGLMFGGEYEKSTEPQPLLQPAVARVVMHLASDGPHRTWLLFGSAGLTLLAFTLLNDAGAGIVLGVLGTVRRLSQAALARYRLDV